MLCPKHKNVSAACRFTFLRPYVLAPLCPCALMSLSPCVPASLCLRPYDEERTYDLCHGYQRWSRRHKARGQDQGHKKIRGQGQGQKQHFRGQNLDLEAKDRNARGQGQGPRTQPQVFSNKKRSFFFTAVRSFFSR